LNILSNRISNINLSNPSESLLNSITAGFFNHCDFHICSEGPLSAFCGQATCLAPTIDLIAADGQGNFWAGIFAARQRQTGEKPEN